MVVTLLGILTVARLVQPLNAEFPIEPIPFGIVMAVRLEQFWKQYAFTSSRLFDKVTEARLVHSAKAYEPIEVTLLGIVMLSRLAHLQKAY